MSGDSSNYAPTKWAQRKDLLLITICVEDCKNTEVKFEPNKIIFRGQGGTVNKRYNAELELYKEIDPEECKWEQTTRSIFIHAGKKISESFWPRLLNTKVKQHWLTFDFDKLKDEDDESSDDEYAGGEQPGLAEMMAQMGKGTGTPDLGDLGESDDSDDSDDEEVPDLETAPEPEKMPKENGDVRAAGESNVCDA